MVFAGDGEVGGGEVESGVGREGGGCGSEGEGIGGSSSEVFDDGGAIATESDKNAEVAAEAIVHEEGTAPVESGTCAEEEAAASG